MGDLNPNNRSIVPKRKSLWKMVKSMLIPRQLLAPLASCAGLSAKRRKRIERLKRGHSLPKARPSRYSNSPSAPSSPSSPDIPIPEPSIESSFQAMTLLSQEAEAETHCSSSNQSVPNENDFRGSFNLISVIVHNSGGEGGGDEGGDNEQNPQSLQSQVILRKKRKAFAAADASTSNDLFLGWRKSSIEVTPDPPLTLKYIPSGLQLGDKVMWVTEPQPERAVVRWIGKIRGVYQAGIEFERRIGNSSGLYGYGLGTFQRLFTCELGFGRFVPITELVLYSDFHDKGLKAGFICVICRDDFLELPDLEEAGEGHMVATKCGHLYHAYCLDQWLAKSLAAAKAKQNSHPRCPHCQIVIQEDDIIRLFPAQV